MRKAKLSKGLRKRIRFEKARLRRDQTDPRPYDERLADVLSGLGVTLTAPEKRDMEKATNETAR